MSESELALESRLSVEGNKASLTNHKPEIVKDTQAYRRPAKGVEPQLNMPLLQ